MFKWDKHSSLFCRSVIDEKKFKNINLSYRCIVIQTGFQRKRNFWPKISSCQFFKTFILATDKEAIYARACVPDYLVYG